MVPAMTTRAKEPQVPHVQPGALAATVSPRKGAAWLQQRIDRDETAFRRRAGAADALERLRSVSEALVHRVDGDRVDLLLGRKLGGSTLGAARDVAAVQAFVTRFYRDHRAVFVASELAEGSLRVERVKAGTTTVADVRQYLDGIPVDDARWTLLFDGGGHLTQVTGAPIDPASLTVGRRPGIDAGRAVELALDHEALAPEDVEASARLAVEGRANRLVWTVELNGRRNPALHRTLGIDAHDRSVVAREDRCKHGTVAIPVTRYTHPGGALDSTGRTMTSEINVDAEGVLGIPDVLFSLQRLGSGRSRIWNAKPVGADDDPLFTRTKSVDPDYFQKRPGLTDDWVFNEQQTYYWAQVLKTAVDEWGREPNEYGHYPVDPSRAVNVEIVVNGDASMENDWKGRDEDWGVQHGFIRNNAPRSWFSGLPSSPAEVQAVFLFNSAGNSGSPQFFGPEHSSSYSIIAHEVGHFITWQYGDWLGPSGTVLGGSLGEGHSMVLAALLGKHAFGSALEHDESEYVTTGGQPQWSHEPALKYSDMDCISTDLYDLAHPFVQAMWRLMNNLDLDGNPIWGSADAAISNTADLFMYGVYCFTSDTTMTWDKLCLGLIARLFDRIVDGLEKDPLSQTFCSVYDVFSEHGLLQECNSSP
jgi:hypothetical protein